LCNCCFWSSTEVIGDGSAVAHRLTLVFVECEGINVSAVRSLRSRSEVEDPDNLVETSVW
jgi:hypothetical protein